MAVFHFGDSSFYSILDDCNDSPTMLLVRVERRLLHVCRLINLDTRVRFARYWAQVLVYGNAMKK